MQENADNKKKEDPVLERLREIQKKTDDRIDEGAKQLITLNGLLQGLFLAAFAFSDLRELIEGWSLIIFILALISLVISLSCAACYFLPLRRRMKLHQYTKSNIQQALEQIYLSESNWRIDWLQRGQIFFLCGLIFSSILMIIIMVSPDIKKQNDTITIIITTPTVIINTPTSSVLPSTVVPLTNTITLPTP